MLHFMRLLFSSNHALNFLLVPEPLLVSRLREIVVRRLFHSISNFLLIRIINYLEVEIENFFYFRIVYMSTVPFFLPREKNFSFTASSIFRIINNSIEEIIPGDIGNIGTSNERIEDFR